MTQTKAKAENPKKFQLSLDAWSVIIALLAAIAIRAGLIARVPW